MSNSIRFKLFLMMVLELFIWGAWLPLIYGYLPSLGFTPGQQSWILNAFPISAIIGMFFSTQFADRHFSAEKFMAFSHLVGGAAILGLAFINPPLPVPGLTPGAPNPNAPFWPFFILMSIHCLLYVPTISIANSIAFAHIKDAQKEFGLIRVGGTIGWILAAWPFTFILVDWAKVHAANPQGFVNWLGTVLGSGLSGEALQHATRWTYIVLILWLVTIVDAFALYSYFNWTGVFLSTAPPAGVGIRGNWIMPVMSIGQVAEILTMLILGAVLKRLGWRLTMVIGILGHVARFAVYSWAPTPGAVITVQLLHGICYAFFFATVYIFVDEYFPKDVRSSAQGLFTAVILGLGSLLANSIDPYLMQTVFTHNGVTDFKDLFLVPLSAALVAAIALALFFRPPPKRQPEPAAAAAMAA